MNRLFVVDDDIATCTAIKAYFSRSFEILTKYNGFDFIETVREFKPDVILLDINLPGPNGFKLLSAIKGLLDSISVFLITVRGGDDDILAGFDLGAVDYIAKPFSLKVLEARLKRWIQKGKIPRLVELGEAKIDLAGARILLKDTTEKLSQKELLVLRYLLANAGQVLSRQQILDYAWGYEYEGTPRTVDNVLVAIRKKLGDSDDENPLIKSHRGMGYSCILP